MKIWLPAKDLIIPKGFVTLLWGDKDGNLKKVERFHNLVTTAAKESWAKAFRGETANNQGIATYHALGTSAVAPALGDVQLGAEIFRKLISVRDDENNVSSFQTFFTTSEGNGTLRELGLFGDAATGVSGSGTLFARAAMNRVKTSSDTLTVLHTMTFG
jgi:hypothetical protein